jgi:hypothetical protein
MGWGRAQSLVRLSDQAGEPAGLAPAGPIDHVRVSDAVQVGAAAETTDLEMVPALVAVPTNVQGLVQMLDQVHEEPQGERALLDG